MQPIIVQKFGGTSVSDVDRIKDVSEKVLRTKRQGYNIVVVVSAMAGVTNQLANYCASVSSLASNQSLAEYDAALSSGEVVTSSLLALALQTAGAKAASIAAWQLPIKTTSTFSKALIRDIDTVHLMHLIRSDIIPVIAGFQGLNDDGRITTLGRGGSDTTAVAVAATLSAERCDIYTDVEGVFTTDPRLVRNACKIDALSYEEMLEFADAGAKVLHTRAVQIAMKYLVPLHVISSFTDQPGTIITSRDNIMETPKITGITYSKNFVAIDITQDTASIILKLTKGSVRIDSIHRKNQQSATLLIPIEDIAKAELILRDTPCAISTDIAILSIIGSGIKNDSTILNRIFSSLTTHEFEIIMMTSSEVKISLMLYVVDVEKAVKILHESLGLDLALERGDSEEV